MAHTAHREAGLEHPPFPPTKVGRVAHLLGAETLHLEYPTQVVFGSVTVGINDGDRIGIVGRNGDGKSSLLGLLTGRIVPDSGRVTRRGGVRVGVLDQADTLDGHQDRRSGTLRRQGRPRMGHRPRDSRRRRRPGVRYRLGCADFDAVGRATTPGAVGRVADGRLGRHRTRRAHQPPRHRGHHLAGRASEGAAGRAVPVGCCW